MNQWLLMELSDRILMELSDRIDKSRVMTKTCDTGTNWKQSNEVVTAQISRGEDVANNNTKNRMLSDSLVMKKV